MKKILVLLGVLVTLFLAALIIVPLVVDVDQYRPQILKIANEKINGKLELGKMKLSLWGAIRVEIGGLDLSDVKGNKVIAVKDAFVAIPWSSIFGGSPLLTFNMQNPEVRILKNAAGKMNVLGLMKDASVDSAAPASGEKTVVPPSPSAMKIPAIVANARIGVDIQNALFYLKDETTRSETVMKNLNLEIKDLSLTRKTAVKVSGLFESSAEKLFKVSGPFLVNLNATPRVESGEFKGLATDVDANFTDVEIQAASVFYKKKGMDARLVGTVDVSKEQLTISKFAVKFFNAEIALSGKIADIQGEPVLDLAVKSNVISLAPWNELVPMLKDYSLSGTASLDAKASGPLFKIQYAADLVVKDLKAKSPMLKAEPVVNLSVKIVTDRVERMLATLKAPGNDLTIDGSVVSFTQPKVDLKVTSNGMDLDQLVKLPPLGADASASQEAAGDKSGGGKVTSADFDALLDPLRKNETAKNTTLVASVNMKTLQFYGVKITDLVTKLSMKNLALSIDSANFKVWDGALALKAQMAMLPKIPTYSFASTISGLNMQKAVTSQFKLLKDTILGKVNFKIDGTGSSLNPEAAKGSLRAKGTMKVTEATFQSIDIAKIASEAVNKALEKLGDKIPGAKGKSIKSVPERSAKYEFIATDFSIAGGHFSAPNFTAKAMKDQGFDLRGATDVGLIDQELKADWEIIDTYNLLKTKDLGFEVSGVKINNVLSEGGGPVVIPVSVACKYTAPCPSYLKVPEHFFKVAMGNVKKGATQALKSEATEKAKDVGKKLLKGLFR